MNFERLGLLPLEPAQFGTVAEIGFPQLVLTPITDPVDTVATAEQAQ